MTETSFEFDTSEQFSAVRGGTRVQDGNAKQRIIPGAEPFFFSGSSNVGCLLVHGFTSTPYDVRACGAYLAEHGISSFGVRVAGHGTSPQDLAQTGYHDWLSSIREGHNFLTSRVDHVYALGISLGGNFLISLTQELSFSGLILVGMPLHFRYQRSYQALYYLSRALGIRYQRKWYQSSLDSRIREERPNYRYLPLACARDVVRAVNHSRSMLPSVRCPVLAVQSTTDHAIDQRTINELTSSLGTDDVTVRWIPDRYHVVLIDHGKEEVFEMIESFIMEKQNSE